MLGHIVVACICVFELEPILKIPFNDCDEIPSADKQYNTEELVKLDSEYVAREIAVSHKTGNIYILDARPNIRVLRRGENGIQEINTQDAIAYSIVMDNTVGKLYIGCVTGLVIYDEEKDRIQFVNNMNYAVWKMFIPINKSKLYAVSWEQNNVIQLSKDDLTREMNFNLTIINGYSDRFVIDGDGNYYFNTHNKDGRDVTGIFGKRKSEPMAYTRYINNLSVDNRGKVFGTNYYDLYQLDPDNPVPQLIKSLNFMTRCIGFDKYNNMVLGTFDKTIVMLKLNNICYYSPFEPIAAEYYQKDNPVDETFRAKWIESRTDFINMIEKNYNDWNKIINETDTKMNNKNNI